MELIIYLRICIDDMGDGVDELDDKLCVYISWSSLSSEKEGCRLERFPISLIVLHSVIDDYDIERVEKLSLVFVDSLYLDIDHCIRINDDAAVFLKEVCSL